MRKLSAVFGLMAVSTFLVSLVVFASLSPDFNMINDVVSKLGSPTQPYAGWWNLIGFGGVGVLLVLFGLTYGKSVEDNMLATILALFGITFIGASVPAYLENPNLTQTKVHFVTVTFSMAFWCLGLARLTSKPLIPKQVKSISYISAAFVILAFIGYLIENTSAAIFQRLFFGGIFFWITAISIDNLRNEYLDKIIE